MTTTDRRDVPIRFDPSFAVGLFLAAALLATSFVPPYGWFIDELYYLSCSRRLAFGYVDMPPLSIALLAAERALFGEGMLAARLLPALSMGAAAWLAGRTARRYGGGTTGELLAALSVAAMPVVLVFGSFSSMNAYEPLVVLGLFALALRLVEEEDARLWLPMGLVLGVGLELKHTMVLFAVAIVAGLLAAGPRRLLFSWWTLGGILACLVLVLPNLAWQVAHGFPSLEHYRNSFLQKNIAKPPFEVLRDQVLFVGPASLPLWLGGLVWLATPGGRRFRFVAVAYLLLLVLVVAGRSSRPDRITSMYPVLLSLGSAAAGRLSRRPWPAVTRGYTVVVVAVGLVLAPIMCPVLEPAPLREYMSALGVQFRIEAGKRDEVVPQWLGDRIGWRELAGEVARVVRALPDEERRGAVLVSTDYGAAGAMEAYGPRLGLPPVFATHNAFHSWGPPPDSASVYVGVQVDEDSVRRLFERVDVASTVRCPDCTRPQKSVRILVLRGPRFSFVEEWPGFHRYH